MKYLILFVFLKEKICISFAFWTIWKNNWKLLHFIKIFRHFFFFSETVIFGVSKKCKFVLRCLISLYFDLYIYWILLSNWKIYKQRFFSLSYKHFNCIWLYAFVVCFNSFKKYADTNAHTKFLYLFLLFWEKFAMICEIYEAWMKTLKTPLPHPERFFFFFLIFSVSKKYIFLRCLLWDLHYVHFILVLTFLVYFNPIQICRERHRN